MSPTRPSPRSVSGAEAWIRHEGKGRLRVAPPALRHACGARASLERRLGSVPGVLDARVNPMAGSVVIRHDGRSPTRRLILKELVAWNRKPDQGDLHERADGPGVPELVLSGALVAGTRLLPGRLRSVATFLNIAPAVLRGASTLVTQGLKVPVLDAAALLTLTLVRGDHQAANTTAFLLRLAEFLEDRTERKSEDLLKGLLAPVPGTAWVETEGRLVERPAASLQVGEVLVAGPGEMILVDGLVVRGAATVNEAVLTGEGLPVSREEGDRVKAGTTVSEGRVHVQAQRVGPDTGLSRIATYIEEALRHPAPAQRLAQELADKRLAYTLGLAGGVFLWTGSLERLAAMLLVDFSCAMKLGVPVAFRSAMQRCALAGAVPKGGSALEALGRADTVVFDKTGTLTRGELRLVGARTLEPVAWPEDRLLAVMASLEEHAQHPVARSIVQASSDRKLGHVDHSPVDFMVAHGLKSEVEGHSVMIGNRHYLEAHEGVAFGRRDAMLARWEKEGRLVVHVAVDGHRVGGLAFEDAVRPEAARVVRELKRDGLELILLTGDRRAPAEHLARRLGLDRVFAEVEPEGKAAVVEALQKQGRRVAFVGDGVNDGPALAKAHVGLAMPKGADLARATADFLLIREDLAVLLEARRIACATLGRLQTHFKTALAANAGIMGAAGLGLLSPMASATLHNGTTLALLLDTLFGHHATPSCAVASRPRRPRRYWADRAAILPATSAVLGGARNGHR